MPRHSPGSEPPGARLDAGGRSERVSACVPAWVDRFIGSVFAEPMVALLVGVGVGVVIGYALASSGGLRGVR